MARLRIFLNSRNRSRPSCLLVNTRLPDKGGLQLQKELKSFKCEIQVIMTSDTTGDVASAVTAMRNGAIDFIEKPVLEQYICDRLQECIERDIEIEVSQNLRAAAAKNYALLSPRQRQVMACCVQGKANKTIAHELGVVVKTVEAHRSAVMKTMAANSLVDLINDARILGVF